VSLKERVLRLSKLQFPLITRCRKIIHANETLKKKRPDPQGPWKRRASAIV